MAIHTKGLVLKVSDIGESDRVVTLLTDDYGVIRAFANRAKKMNSKIQSSTQLLSYSDFSVYTGNNSYIIDSAEVIEVFFGLRNDIEKLALGQYFCSLALELIPEGEPSSESLRVILNSLSFLQNEKRSREFIKAVTELKLLSIAGFAPNVEACSSCGKSPSGDVFFNLNSGRFTCRDCSGNGKRISAGILTALRFVIYNPVDRMYSFALSPDDMLGFSHLCESFLLAQTKKEFKTLNFYKSVIS